MSEHEAFSNFVHREVLRVLHRQTRRTPVVVDSYDPATHAVKVRLMPDSVDDNDPVVTGWISLHPLQTGNQFGWHMPPNIGDPGWVEFHEDDREAGQFVSATFNDKFPPVSVEGGEWLYKNKWGALINFKKDGSVTVTDKSGSTIISDGNGKITLQGQSGNKVLLNADGTMAVAPEGENFLFLGGDGSTGSYDFVVTNSGPSINVKARIA
jgi:phage baseplate assembly protein gpV